MSQISGDWGSCQVRDPQSRINVFFFLLLFVFNVIKYVNQQK